jgi:hypothetical protein
MESTAWAQADKGHASAAEVEDRTGRVQLRARLSTVSTPTVRAVRHHLDPMISGLTDDQRQALRCIYERMSTHRRCARPSSSADTTGSVR